MGLHGRTAIVNKYYNVKPLTMKLYLIYYCYPKLLFLIILFKNNDNENIFVIFKEIMFWDLVLTAPRKNSNLHWKLKRSFDSIKKNFSCL